MIEKIHELNRILLAVNDLKDSHSAAYLKSVIEQCESTVIEGRMPDHRVTLEFAVHIGFLKLNNDEVVLTHEGQAFIELNPESMYDLSEGQKKIIIRNCFLHGALRNETYALLSGFSPSYKGETFRWSAVDDSPLQAASWLVNHLCQLGVLTRGPDWLEVAKEYVNTVATFLDEGVGWTEAQFLDYMKEKSEVGSIAEKHALLFENKRLLSLGHVVESRCVRNISKLRVNAGYDIESFNGKSVGLNYDRFIEVKGAKSPSVHFFWSDNEMKIARKLRHKYWIYFQGGINSKTGDIKNEILVFQDPIESIMNSARFEKIPQGLIVTSGDKGKLYSK